MSSLTDTTRRGRSSGPRAAARTTISIAIAI
jgi:hypothetical protein